MDSAGRERVVEWSMAGRDADAPRRWRGEKLDSNTMSFVSQGIELAPDPRVSF